jgi:hypothetical protein
MRINGDDAIVVAYPDMYDAWKRDVESVGLSLSVGKSYRSRLFGIINSVLFKVEHNTDFFGQRYYILNERPYLSLGLLQCMNIKKGVDERDPLYVKLPDVESCFDNIMRSVTESGFDQKFACDNFLRHWRGVLNEAPRGMSWFLPRRLGGLGFTSYKYTLSEQQRKLAAYLISPRSLESELQLKKILSITKNNEGTFWSYCSKILDSRKEEFEIFETEPGLGNEDAYDTWLPVLGPRAFLTGAVLKPSDNSCGNQWIKWFRKLWKVGLATNLQPLTVTNLSKLKSLKWRNISRIGPMPKSRRTAQLLNKLS